MVRNGKAIGILATMKGWCFLRRMDHGILYMTPMFGDFVRVEGLTNGAQAEGYHLPQGFSIMKALYFISSFADLTADLPETPRDGLPGHVFLPRAGDSAKEAPRIQQPDRSPSPSESQASGSDDGSYNNFSNNGGYHVVGGYDKAECVRFDDTVDYSSLLFEPWKSENNLGIKTWIATVLPQKDLVVLKLWDGWNFDTEDRDREASAYIQLRPLWGTCVPALRVKTALDYFHALILQYIPNVFPLLELY